LPVRLLTRYVLAELLKIFIAALTVLTMMLLVIGLVKQGREQGLGPAQIVRLVPYVLPDMLRYTIPATLLFAVSSVYGRMSGSNEVVALKSLGIGPMTVLWPCFILASFLSLLTVWLNDVAVTWSQANIQRVVIEAVEEIAYGMLRTQRSYSNKSFTILVKRVEGKRLLNPIFTLGGGDTTITAREAELQSDGEVLRIVCRDGAMNDSKSGVHYSFDEMVQGIPLLDASRKTDDSHIPTRVPLSMISEEVEGVKLSLHNYQRRQAAQVGLALATGDFDPLAAKDWARDKLVIQDFLNHLSRLCTEPPRRMSAGFSCLCFVLVGAPMAIWRRNSDFLTSFFLCFGPILIVYYPLLVFGVEQAKSGAMHPYIVWLGNVVLGVCGIWLLRSKVLRH
jgi:lipopolysaccharide export system permease protein